MAQDELAEESAGETYAEELARFAADLTALRIEQGKPPLQDIARHAPPARALSQPGVWEALAGRRLPGIDFLMALVKTLLLLGDPQRRPPAENDPRLDHWRQRWGRLQRLQTYERRARLVPASDVADTPTPEHGAAAPEGNGLVHD